MAKVTRPEKEIEVCDRCGRETTCLDKCKVCGDDYCVTCRAIIVGCIHTIEVCEKCGDKEEVEAISKKFAPRIREILAERDSELGALNFPA